MASLNKVFLIGRLTRDPEFRRVPSGDAVSNFTLAVNRHYKTKEGEKQEEVAFVDVVIWGKQAEIFNEYMSKGREVLIEGRIKQDKWQNEAGENRTRLKVVCTNFQLMSRKEKVPESEQAPQAPASSDSDTIPF